MIQEDETLAIFARRIVAEDPGVPLGLLLYRMAGNRTPSNGERRGLFQVVNGLILSGWLRDVSEGDGPRPVSRRFWISTPFCNCGDSIYNGHPCPDDNKGVVYPDPGLLHCPSRKRVNIDHE